MHIAVIIIVVVIILLQLWSFFKNKGRMKDYKDIFAEEDSWDVTKDPETGFVDGVEGEGNKIFESIIESMNKYLEKNSGSVVEFGLLKDAVDRHTDSVENDIAAQTPVPLYLGLAGTMLGVILGLWALISSGAIGMMLRSQDGNAAGLEMGITELLSGVAIAMVASIFGIVLTTLGSLLFKKYKLEGERGKNTFIAWMQSTLLPQLPSNTGEAMQQMVQGLNNFNQTFASNTAALGSALHSVNQLYHDQAAIIQAVHDMDLLKMAQANVKVLKQLDHSVEILQDCIPSLESFNDYLNGLNDFTQRIQNLGVLTQLANSLTQLSGFFDENRQALKGEVIIAGEGMKKAMKEFADATREGVNELRSDLTERHHEWSKELKEQHELMDQTFQNMQAKFEKQLETFPQTAAQLDEVAKIPARLDDLAGRIEKANEKLAQEMKKQNGELLTKAVQAMTKKAEGGAATSPDKTIKINIPKRTQWVMAVSGVVVAASCLTMVVMSFFK